MGCWSSKSARGAQPFENHPRLQAAERLPVAPTQRALDWCVRHNGRRHGVHLHQLALWPPAQIHKEPSSPCPRLPGSSRRGNSFPPLQKSWSRRGARSLAPTTSCPPPASSGRERCSLSSFTSLSIEVSCQVFSIFLPSMLSSEQPIYNPFIRPWLFSTLRFLACLLTSLST